MVRVSVIPNASASTPSRTPANLSADMALGGSGHADAINSYSTRAACFTNLRDHAVRLMKRHGRHGLHGCRQGQGKSNSDQSDHSFLQCEPSRLACARAEHSDAKKAASDQFGTDRTPEALFARVPGGKYRHISGHIFRLDGGVLAMWPPALHITVQALRYDPYRR